MSVIKLKSLELKSRVFAAPMAGCSDLAFRLIAREKGMELAFLEMVSAEALVRRNKKTLNMLAQAPEDRPLGAQIVGCDPGAMAEAASMLEIMGYDVIDINCGCPVPKIVSPGGGSALLLEPQKAGAIFKRVADQVKKIPVTVKMRKGYSDASGQEAVRLASLAEQAGISAVTVHGRTRVQGYTGPADWSAVKKVKDAVKIPVFGNGDVHSGSDARRLLDTTGCDAVMIGRGGLGNPWIYRRIDAELKGAPLPPDPSLEERKQTALKHLDLEILQIGEKQAVLKFRRIGCWYIRSYPGASELRNTINSVGTAEEVRAALRRFGSDNKPAHV